MRYIVSGILLLALLLGLLALWMANRQWHDYEKEGKPASPMAVRPLEKKDKNPLPLQTIIGRLQLPKGTRILEIEREHRSHIMHYEFELVTAEGRFYELHVDPYTAEIVEREKED